MEHMDQDVGRAMAEGMETLGFMAVKIIMVTKNINT